MNDKTSYSLQLCYMSGKELFHFVPLLSSVPKSLKSDTLELCVCGSHIDSRHGHLFSTCCVCVYHPECLQALITVALEQGCYDSSCCINCNKKTNKVAVFQDRDCVHNIHKCCFDTNCTQPVIDLSNDPLKIMAKMVSQFKRCHKYCCSMNEIKKKVYITNAAEKQARQQVSALVGWLPTQDKQKSLAEVQQKADESLTSAIAVALPYKLYVEAALAHESRARKAASPKIAPCVFEPIHTFIEMAKRACSVPLEPTGTEATAPEEERAHTPDISAEADTPVQVACVNVFQSQRKQHPVPVLPMVADKTENINPSDIMKLTSHKSLSTNISVLPLNDGDANTLGYDTADGANLLSNLRTTGQIINCSGQIPLPLQEVAIPLPMRSFDKEKLSQLITHAKEHHEKRACQGGYFVQQYDKVTKMLYRLSQLNATERRTITEVDKARSKSLGPILGPLVWHSPERESLLYVATNRIDYDRLYDAVSPCTPREPFNIIHLATNPGGILFRIMDLHN